MNATEFQAWLNAHGASLAVDGQPGPATRAAIAAVFTNLHAPAVTDAEITGFAEQIGCAVKQLRAVAKVESGGAAFDTHGRPKILFERHYFHRLTEGRWSVCAFSNPDGGGYAEDSWDKLVAAACRDPWAAFQSASWGKFQIMGAHWKALGYASPLEMAWSMRESEAGHYDALVRFVTVNGLGDEIRAISRNPADNAAFASKYNGPGFRKFSYDEKLAVAMGLGA
jgi:hypothetical protein